MDISRLYKYTIYDASKINEIDPLKITSNIRWSIDKSKFIVEWTTTPENDYMTMQEARLIMNTPEWSIIAEDIEIDEI